MAQNPPTNAEQFLQDVLEKRDEALGFNGEYSFVLSVQKSSTEFAPIIAVKELSEKAARILFDQFDENNLIFPDKEGRAFRFRISLMHQDDEVDYNLIPNAFTEVAIATE